MINFECSVSSLKALILNQASSVTCSRFLFLCQGFVKVLSKFIILGGKISPSLVVNQKPAQFVRGDLADLKGNIKSLMQLPVVAVG